MKTTAIAYTFAAIAVPVTGGLRVPAPRLHVAELSSHGTLSSRGALFSLSN
jgi:hypothetical protein